MGKGGHQVHALNPKLGHYEGRITKYVIVACIVGAFGGLIFGYDIGISGIVGIMIYVYHSHKVIKVLIHTRNTKNNKPIFTITSRRCLLLIAIFLCIDKCSSN